MTSIFYRLVCCTLLLAAGQSARAADAMEGAWRYASSMWTVHRSGEHVEVKVSSQGGTGWSYSANSDGREYPVTGLGPGVTVKVSSVSAKGFEAVLFRNRKEMSRNKVSVTGDGYSLTVETIAGEGSLKIVLRR